MGFIVVQPGGMNDKEYYDYIDAIGFTLLKRGVRLESVPRVPDESNRNRWLYVWDTRSDAEEFIPVLKRRMGKRHHWQVEAVKAPPSVGPLCPLQINLTFHWESWSFSLDLLTEYILKGRYPGSCPYRNVMIGTLTRDARPTIQELRYLADRALLLLTGLTIDQLKPFDSFRVAEPVEAKQFLPPTPIVSISAGWEARETSCSEMAGG